MNEIRECPFCGSDSHQIVITPTGIYLFVQCLDCGAEGPRGDTISKSEDEWNTRAYDAELTRQQQEIERIQADYDRLNQFDQTQSAKLLQEIAKLRPDLYCPSCKAIFKEPGLTGQKITADPDDSYPGDACCPECGNVDYEQYQDWLEDEVERLEGEAKAHKSNIDALYNMYHQAEQECQAVKNERDAAVAVVTEYKDCQDCAHYLTDMCKRCDRVKTCDNFPAKPCWQWRGPAKEGE